MAVQSNAAPPYGAAHVAGSAPSTSVSLKETLLTILDSYESEAVTLFSSLESGTLESLPDSAALVSSLGGIVAGRSAAAASLERLSVLDSSFAQALQMAREHSLLQAEISKRVEHARRVDARLARTTRILQADKERLGALLKAGDIELARAQRAEKEPISTASLLSYASSLSRVTSAPPSFRLDKDLPAVVAGMMAGPDNQEEEDPTVAEEGQDGDDPEAAAAAAARKKKAKNASNAVANHNPAMPSMPVELPFPDEGAMGAGLLFSRGGRETLSWEAFIAEEQAAAEALPTEHDHALSAEQRAEYERQMQERMYQQRKQQQRMEEEAFDLDLN